jgi:lysozyme
VDRDRLLASITDDEGDVLHVYDDWNGQKVVPGYTLIGHPTVGRGRALDTNGISEGESVYLCSNDIDDRIRALPLLLDFWSTLSDVRQNALLEMSFQMGVRGLVSGYPHMITFLRAGDFAAAAKECTITKAPTRAAKLAAMIETDQWPT